MSVEAEPRGSSHAPSSRSLDVEPVPHAATPTLRFDLHVDEPAGREIHTIALTTQIQIEPARRAYDAETRERLVELFGAPERWASTTQSLPLGAASTRSSRLHRRDDVRARRPVHVRPRGRGERSTSTRCPTARCRCRSTSTAWCSTAASDGPAAGRARCRGAARRAGACRSRVEGRDGRLLPGRRLGPAATHDDARRARGAKAAATGCRTFDALVAELLAEAG